MATAPTLNVDITMTSITSHLTVVSVPPGTEHKAFHVSIPHLRPDAGGWAWYRPRPTWIEAQRLASLDELKENTVHMLLLHNGDEYVCVLPVSSETGLANLSREATHGLVVNVRGSSHSRHGRVAVVVSRTHNARYIAALCGAAVDEARKWLMKKPPAYLPLKPGPLDGVGFCTWNALHEGRNVNEGSIRHLVDTLVGARLPIQTFIVDDGWHDKRHFRDKSGEDDRRRGLWSFDAKPEIGAGGMKGIVDMVKERLGSVEWTGEVDVGAWIALTGGYWDGIHPDSPLVDKYGCKKYPASRQWWRGCPEDALEPNHMPSGESFYVLPPPERAAEFWGDWFKQLHNAGITFLKVDNQAAVTALDGVDGVHEALYIWESMYTAAERVFGPDRVIHCMSHSEPMWAGPQGLGLTTGGRSFIWRNSDDFGLTGRSPYAHQQHLFTNLMNTLIANAQCTVPDADMFMTTQQHPHAHALLRALFPGPLLLTDKPGEHDPELLWRLVSRDKGGVARVLKASRAAEPLARRLLDTSILDYADGSGQWAAATVGPHTILGCWNVRGGYDKPCRVVDDITVADVEDAIGHEIDKHYVVARVGVEQPGVMGASVLIPGDKGAIGHIDDLAMLTAASFWIVPCQHQAVGFTAVLGLINHFAGPAALDGFEISINSITVRLKYAGTLGIVVDAPFKPSATALIDKRPEVVKVTQLESLSKHKQEGVFLLTVDVGNSNNHPTSDSDVWDVLISIE
ncbi:uncharacterized protein CcaverHIS019_0511560 [Cutaneotrichosporon cavernicola]|uniref:Alpha-galactosidase n=1 Tax=Cutaneotrichosporon cavernicola TaxID=279322 RepID=A0AA48QXN0_9TREE|nr:uncharacterized protein CcaverHIS019_0511560 [Cutaneotrichosporon cavernicola]BEI93528.1 hypothetical protein CcaverHIS019_0511560 [Cutaneotrichosporon cavernicola]